MSKRLITVEQRPGIGVVQIFEDREIITDPHPYLQHWVKREKICYYNAAKLIDAIFIHANRKRKKRLIDYVV
jgi:hypothetical protein